jgi:uncharacterized protein
LEVEFTGAGVRLSGTVSCPDQAANVPGLVLIGGSGPSDRHNDGFFDALRHHLVGAGVAVLAYDKRGVGASTGAWPAATVDELAGDAAAALGILRGHPGVAPETVGLLGHSEGGWVGLRVCAGHLAPAFLILNSCPAVSFLEAETFALAAAGVEQHTARAVLGELVEAVRSGLGAAEAQQILDGHKHEAWYPTLEGFVLDDTTWAQWGAWFDYDPERDLEHLTVPTLALLGENDAVVPVQVSVDRYEQTAEQATRQQRTKVFPDADHRLRTSTGFAPGYLSSISSWCHDCGHCPDQDGMKD